MLCVVLYKDLTYVPVILNRSVCMLNRYVFMLNRYVCMLNIMLICLCFIIIMSVLLERLSM